MSSKPIPHTRLEAIPFARFTVECQQQLEKRTGAAAAGIPPPSSWIPPRPSPTRRKNPPTTTTRKKRKTRPCPRRQTDPAPPPHPALAPEAPHRHHTEALDFKNVELLKKFLTEKGRILPRRITGMTAKMHRKLIQEIKRARNVLLVK